MYTLDQLGIKNLNGGYADCPICGKHTLFVRVVESSTNLKCECGAAGDLLTGFEDRAKDKRNYITIKDLESEIWEIIDKGLPAPFPTDWPCVNEYYNVALGQWTLLTGMPGSGKSEWLDALLVGLAVQHDHKFCIFSPENLPIQGHVKKLFDKFVGKDVSGKFRKATTTEIMDAMDFFGNHFYFCQPESKGIEAILDTIAELVAIHRITGAVIDPWNELDHYRPETLSETEYVSLVLSRIRAFARLKNIHIWLVAHPTKMKRNDDGSYNVPKPYDVSGSAHFYNKADNCVSIWRDSANEDVTIRNTVQVHVQKIRFKHVGKIGVTELRWDFNSGYFADPACPKGDLNVRLVEKNRRKNDSRI